MKGIVVMIAYVDNIILSGDDVQGILETKQHLQENFVTKDLAPLHYFLGIVVVRSKGVVFSQNMY